MKLSLELFRRGETIRTASFENGAVPIIKIGRSPSPNELSTVIQLDDDPSVARIHAVIEITSSEFLLTDLGSARGTRVNGTTIKDVTALRSGDVITIGETGFNVTIGPDTVDENIDQSSPEVVHAALGAADTAAHEVGLVRILGVVGDADPNLLVDADELFKYLRHCGNCDFLQPMWHKGPCDCGLHALTAKFPSWMRQRVLELSRTDVELRVYGPDPHGLFAKVEEGDESP